MLRINETTANFTENRIAAGRFAAVEVTADTRVAAMAEADATAFAASCIMTRTFSRNVYGMVRNDTAATYYEEPVR